MLRRAILACLFLCPAAAAQFVPCNECTGTVWYVDASSSGGGGNSWNQAFPDLQSAIDAASPGDCIWVAAGRYTPSSTGDRSETYLITKSLKIYGGFDGSEVCFSERGPNYTGTRLSGDIGLIGHAPDNSYRVVTIQGPPPIGQQLDVLIDGFNIRDAYNNNTPDYQGGGIYCELATKLTIKNCTIRNNLAFTGGGMYVTSTPFDIVFSQFIGNDADGPGAGLWAADPQVDPHIYNTVFKTNDTSVGGAIYFSDFGPSAWARMMNVLIHDNQGNQGGAIYLAEANPQGIQYEGRAQLVNCTIANQDATNTVLHAEESSAADPGRFDLRNCVVWGNDFLPALGVLAFTDGLGGSFGNSVVAHAIVEPDQSYFDCDFDNDCVSSCTNYWCDPVFTGTTFHLGSGSAAIDEGDSPLLPDVFDFDGDGNTAEDVPWDLDGDTRVQGLETDRGCYEDG